MTRLTTQIIRKQHRKERDSQDLSYKPSHLLHHEYHQIKVFGMSPVTLETNPVIFRTILVIIRSNPVKFRKKLSQI